MCVVFLHICLYKANTSTSMWWWQSWLFCTENGSLLLCGGESKLLGGPVDKFANNTVISPQWAKHASVCLLIPNKRTVHLFASIHRQRQTFPLLCRPLSFYLFYSPPPFPSEPRKDTLTHSPRNKRGGLSDHTQSKDLWLTLLSCLPSLIYFTVTFLSVSIHISRSLAPHLLCVQPDCGESCVLTFPCLRLRSSGVFRLCLFDCADMNCKDDGHFLWYIYLWDRPPSQPGQDLGRRGSIFQRLHCSQGSRAEWD